MIDSPLPPHIEAMMNWLLELYSSRSQLYGELIHLCDQKFGEPCEFAKAFQDQEEEKAALQWWSCIESLYDLEKAHILVSNLIGNAINVKK